MASSPFISVSLERVKICRHSKGDGSGGYDSSSVTCTWKAPRALTGLLASTAHSSSFHYRRSERRFHRVNRYEASNHLPLRRLVRSDLLHQACGKWVAGCSSSFSSGYDEVSPEHLWEDLKPAIAYLTSDELNLVHDALNLAFDAHNGQKRRSGEPFIIHPVEVAKILGELELDWESIAAGLLHDTVEDTNLVTFEEIEKEFGATVRRIVEGETKVSKLGKLKYKNESHSVQDVKAHDLRQMFLAMTEEVMYLRNFQVCNHVNGYLHNIVNNSDLIYVLGGQLNLSQKKTIKVTILLMLGRAKVIE